MSVDVNLVDLAPRDRADIVARDASIVVPLAHVDVVLPHAPNADLLAIDSHAGLEQHAEHPARVGLIPSDIHPRSLIATHPTEAARVTPYEKRTYPPRKCCDSRVYEYHRVGCPEVPMCACGHTVASHSPEGCFACAGPPCSGPTFTPVDTDTGNLLDLIADDERKADDYATFLRACETDAECYGYVSVNRVRKRLSNEYGLTIHPRTYSAFWSKACRKGGPMVTSTEWEVSDDRHGKNMGKPVRKRLWVGA